MTEKQLAEELRKYHRAMFLIGETCVDVSKCHIDAEDAIDEIRSNIHYSSVVTQAIIEGTLGDEEGIKDAPTTDVVERKRGKWIITDMENNRVWHCNCSECGEDPIHYISGTEDWWINQLPNFCPNCGCTMEGKYD